MIIFIAWVISLFIFRNMGLKWLQIVGITIWGMFGGLFGPIGSVLGFFGSMAYFLNKNK